LPLTGIVREAAATCGSRFLRHRSRAQQVENAQGHLHVLLAKDAADDKPASGVTFHPVA
jgi:hypothetical protein